MLLTPFRVLLINVRVSADQLWQGKPAISIIYLFLVICFTWPRKLRQVDFRTCSQRLVSCAGIAEVKGSNPVQAWILPGFFFRNCKNYFKSFLSLRNRVLRVSNGLDEPGPVNWDLALCLLLAWIICYLCVCKGVKSSGKVSKQSQGCKLAARWME